MSIKIKELLIQELLMWLGIHGSGQTRPLEVTGAIHLEGFLNVF